jgi:hypothetical protein
MKFFKIPRLHPVAFICLMSFLGCTGASSIYFLSPIIPFGAWELAITPPTKAVKLLAYQFPKVFLETDDNNIYSCEPLDHWQLVDPTRDRSRNICARAGLPQQVGYKRPFCPDPNQLTPLVPGRVIDTLSLRDCGVDGYVDIHFILLDDGTVWQWLNFQGGYGSELEPIILGAVGAIAGAGFSLFLMLGGLLWKRLSRLFHARFPH